MLSFKNYQVAIITEESQKYYFTNYSSEDGYLLLSKEQNFFVTDLRYFYAVEKVLVGTNFKAVIGKDYTFLAEYLKKVGVKSLGIDFTKTTLQEFKELKKLCPKIVDISLELQQKFLLKEPKEIQNIKKACEITQKVFLEILDFIKEGISEQELVAEIIYRFLKLGASDVSFYPIVAFGENSAVPHHKSGNTKLRYGMPVLIDMGCKVNSYCSDFTRTFYYGDPPKQFIKDYNAVLSAFEESFKSVKVGLKTRLIDKVARDILQQENLDFKHSLGHGVGLYIHEQPTLSPSSKEEFKNGQVFSIEPGAYKNGEYGIRIEDLVYLNQDKLVNFYTVTKRLIILDKNNKQFIY